MALKTFKPYTKSTRGTILVSREGLWKGKPFKNLTSPNNSSKGRNNYGRITSRNHGGGHKHKYRQIDFYRKKLNSTAEVERIEYDPNRSAFISLIKYEDGDHKYIISPKNIKIGEKIISGDNVAIKNGNCLPINNIPVGTNIHNIELKPGAGAQLIRSAGSSAQIVSKEQPYVQIKLVSGEIRHINKYCMLFEEQ